MNRKTMNIAVAILLSLGVAACSSSGGGSNNAVEKDLQNKTNSPDITNGNNNSNGNNGNNGKTKNDLSPRKLTPEEIAQEKARKAAEEAAKKAEEDAAKEAARKLAEEEAARKASITKYFAGGDSAAYAAVSDPATKAAVTSTIDSSTGTCDQSPAPACYDRSVEKGKVLATQKQAYSSFATLRETFSISPLSEQQPVNSFVYFVGTPTTDVAAVVDANYRGAAKFSSGNKLDVTNANVTLSVRNSKLAGELLNDSAGVIASLDATEVKIVNGMVGFNGTASFIGANFGLPGTISGTYKGVFAGAAAEEVVGTFESNSTERTQSIQGAFSATKQ